MYKKILKENNYMSRKKARTILSGIEFERSKKEGPRIVAHYGNAGNNSYQLHRQYNILFNKRL